MSFGHETRPANKYSHKQYFFGLILHDLEDWVPNPDPFLLTNLRQLIENQS